ncbi:MFS transporter [Sphingomonas sp. CCH18-H6]|uniref:MFS transporter n=1 Tax=Sphingomonas sp. CCH18-H6 TaxID=1768787 RepID=UPI00082F0B21|nr:MFS transporter [Sphingomonas sp. CCH18-H6]
MRYRSVFDERPRLTVGQLAAFSLLSMPLAILVLPLIVYLPAYYGKEQGLDLAVVGAIFLIARALDALSDPVIGVLSDRTSAVIGPRKLWVLLAGGVLAASVWVLCAPWFSVGPVLLLVLLVACYVAWSAVQVPYLAWAGEIAADYRERNRIVSAREAFGMVGIVVATASPLLFLPGGSPQLGEVLRLYAVLIVGMLLVGLLGALAIPDASHGRRDSHIRMSGLASAVWANVPFVRAAGGMLLAMIGISINNSVIVFIIERWWAAGSSYLNFLFLMYACSIPSVLLLPKITVRMEKHVVFACGCLVFSACYAGMLLVPTVGPWLAWMLFAVFGLSLPAIVVPMPSMAMDAADLGDLRMRQPAMGAHMAVYSLLYKLSAALGVGVALPLLSVFGFAPAGANGPRALSALAWIGCVGPAFLLFVAAVLAWRHPLDSRAHGIIVRRLSRRRDRI